MDQVHAPDAHLCLQTSQDSLVAFSQENAPIALYQNQRVDKSKLQLENQQC
jgi:hypothetical protein